MFEHALSRIIGRKREQINGLLLSYNSIKMEIKWKKRTLKLIKKDIKQKKKELKALMKVGL